MSIGQRHINLFAGLVVFDPDPIGPIAALVVAPGQMLSLLKNVVGVGIGLQLAPESMGRSEYIANVHHRRDINGIFRHGQRA
jgi:hypothetical protein